MRLRIHVQDHEEAHDDRHENAAAYVRRLGIRFERFVPQEIADQVMFDGVDPASIPPGLPDYFRFSES